MHFYVIQSRFYLELGQRQVIVPQHVALTATSCRRNPAPQRVQTFPTDCPAQTFQKNTPSMPVKKSVTWSHAKVKRIPEENFICDIQGLDWGEWGTWSACSANCTLGKHNGEETRQRNLRDDPSHEPDIQRRPCDGHCPPGIMVETINSSSRELNSFLKDCSKFDLDLWQVSRGPSYKMSSNMTRPATDDVSSLTLVSHTQPSSVGFPNLYQKSQRKIYI